MSGDERRRALTGVVSLEGVRKTYDGKTYAVEQLDLTIEPGEFLALLGPSGSGKTTTLMMLAGFEQPSTGDILLNGRSILGQPPHARDFGMVFQNYALFPHLSVADNIAFPLSVRRRPRAETEERVKRMLDLVRLGGFGHRFPGQLSGGQQQRVALARALVFEPRLVLMDEPLGALDKRLREEMQHEIKRLHRTLGLTVVYVTHDQGEAMSMSDRVAVFHEGRIRQFGPPRVVHEAPADGFVARFVGETNALLGVVKAVSGGRVRLRLGDGTEVLGVAPDGVQCGERRLVSIRPERIRLNPPAPADNMFELVVEDTTYLGDRISVLGRLNKDIVLSIDLGVAGLDNSLAIGQRMRFGWSSEHCLVLKPE